MKNSVLKTQIIIMLFMMLGKAIGFFREIILASKFGTSYEMDTYSFSITILLFLATIGYAMTTIIIPIFTKIKENTNIKEQEKIANNLINFVVLLGLIISTFNIVISKEIVVLFAPGFSGESFEVARKLITIMSFSIIFILVQGVITGVLQANNRFYAPAAMTFAGNTIMIVYLLVFVDKFGIIGFGYVTLFAYLVQLLINIPSYRKLGFGYYFYINLKDENLKGIIKLSISVLVSTCIIQMATFVNNFYGSLIGEGSIAIYNYANRIINLGVEILPIGISMVIYPMLSKTGANKESKEFNRILREGIILICIVMIPISVFMIVLRMDIIRILYERNSFTSYSTIVTAQMLSVLVPTMLTSGIRDLLNKAFYSLKEVKIPMKISIVTIIITVLINFILYKKIGISSLGISTSFTNIIGVVITYILFKRKFSFISLNIIKSIIKIVIASVVSGLILYFIKLYLSNTIVLNILELGALGIIAVLIYISLLMILDVKEFRLILKKRKRG